MSTVSSSVNKILGTIHYTQRYWSLYLQGRRSNLHQQYRSAVRAFQSSNSSTDQSSTSTSSSQQTNNDTQDIIQSPSPNSWVAEYLRRASTGTLDDNDCRPLMRHPLRRQSSVYTIEDDNSAGSHPPPHPRASQIQHLDSFIYWYLCGP